MGRTVAHFHNHLLAFWGKYMALLKVSPDAGGRLAQPVLANTVSGVHEF